MIYKIGEIIFTLSVIGLLALLALLIIALLEKSNKVCIKVCIIAMIIATITIYFFIVGVKILSKPEYKFEYLESQKVLADKNLQEFLDKHEEFK